MGKKSWSLIDQYLDEIKRDKKIVALSYSYLKSLEEKDPIKEILAIGIKENLAAELSKEELENINKIIDEIDLDMIAKLLISLFNMPDYSKQLIQSSSNDSIIGLASSFLDFKDGEFADFCSGNGRMLSKAIEKGSENLRGIEINQMAYQLSILRLWIEHGLLLNKEINNADIFEYFKEHPEEEFSQIFSEFPLASHRREPYTFEGIKISRNSDWGFIALSMNQLKEGGRAVVISTLGIETRKTDEEIREHFIREGYIEEVIALPEKILTGTSIPSFMLVLSHNNESIRFTDASNSYSKIGRLRVFEEEDIERIMHSDELKTTVSIKKVLTEGRLSPEYYLLPEIKDGKKIGEFAEVLNSRSVPRKEIDKYSALEDKSFELIRLSHVKDGQILAGDFITEMIPRLVQLEDLDLLVTRTGSKLNVALYQKKDDRRSFVDENFFVIRVKDKNISPYYLFAYLQSKMGQRYLFSSYSGTIIQRINKKDLVQLDIPFVDPSDHRRISKKTKEHLDNIKELQVALEAAKEETKESFNSSFKES